MKNIGNVIGLLALMLIGAPLCWVLYVVLAVIGGLVKVILWPTKALLEVVASLVDGGVSSK